MATERTIDEVFATCMAMYPLTAQEKDGRTLDLLRNAWHGVLADVPDDLLNAVALDYFRHAHDWRPTPGHLYDAAMKASENNAEAMALAAWQKFRDWEYGHFGDKLDDPLILKAIQSVGGIEYIGNLDSEKVNNYVRRDFIKTYQMLKESEQARGGLALGSGTNLQPRIAANVTATAAKLKAW